MNFPERVRVDTSSRDRSLWGLQVFAPGWGWAQPARAPPLTARRPRRVGGSKLAPGAPRARTCAGAASETGARRLRLPRRLGGGACAAGAGARPGPARGWGGGGRWRAAPGARPRRRGETRRARGRRAQMQRETLHWGARAAAQVRRGGRGEGGRRGAARGGEELASRRRWRGGGASAAG